MYCSNTPRPVSDTVQKIEAIKSTSSGAMLEPIELWAFLVTEMFFYELTNMIVVPAPTDGCSVCPILLGQHISSCARQLIIY